MSIKSVNEKLLDLTIRRSVFLEQYKTHEVREIMAFLNLQVEPDIVQRLQSYSSRSWTARRLRMLRKEIERLSADGMAELTRRFNRDMVRFGQQEATWQTKVLGQSVPLEISFVTPSVPMIREMLQNRPVYGKFVSDWFADLAPSLAGRVSQQIMIGVTEGDGVDQIVRRIVGTRVNQYTDGILQVARREAEAVVRTSIAGISSNTRDTVYAENMDVVKAVMWTASLDAKTCEACGALDGVTYDVQDGKRPPLHWNCRCTTIPVTRSWKELGLDAKDLDTGLRASMNGYVPGKLSYPDWLKDQTAAVQRQALGVRKAELFRSGQVSFDRFVDDRSRIRTLDELEELL